MEKVLLASLLIFVSSCAANNPDEGDLSASEDEEMVCEYIAKTGSNLKKKRCMTKALSDELAREAKQDLREAWKKGQTQAHTTL